MAYSRLLESWGKHAWLILFLIWAVHLVLSARDFFPSFQDVCVGCLPGGQTPILVSTGLTWSQLAISDPRFATYLASVLFDDGISGVGLSIFGMVVSYTGYRNGQKWAWYLSWVNPIGIIAAQLNIYFLTASILTIVLTVVFLMFCMLGLFLPYRQFFPRAVTDPSGAEKRLSKTARSADSGRSEGAFSLQDGSGRGRRNPVSTAECID